MSVETDGQQQTDRSAAQRATTPSPVNPPPDDDSFYRKGVRLLYGVCLDGINIPYNEPTGTLLCLWSVAFNLATHIMR